jgi:riboflavin biosynthesis pyrimidine reductase
MSLLSPNITNRNRARPFYTGFRAHPRPRDAGLVDEIDIQFLPAVVGRAEAPAIFEGYDFGAAGSSCDLRLISTESRPDGSIFIRYAVR